MIESLIVRPGRAADLALVKDTWSRSFGPQKSPKGPLGDRWVELQGKDGPHHVAPNIWHRAKRAEVDRILDAGAAVLVGHIAAEDRVVMGWLVADLVSPSRLHYVWVRQDVRRRGYATKLLQALAALAETEWRTTHLTPDGQRLIEAWRSKS